MKLNYALLMVISGLMFSGILTAAEWYEGGTLHKATAKTWHASSAQNQLATSADFVAAAKAAKSMAQLQLRSAALKTCISTSTADPDHRYLEVSEVAAVCIVLLGY